MTNNGLLDEVLHPGLCYLSEWLGLYPFYKVVNGHKQEFLLS